jgi:hypothetical protein
VFALIDAEKITDVTHVFAILQQELTKAHAQSPNCTQRVIAKFLLLIQKYLLSVHQSVFKCIESASKCISTLKPETYIYFQLEIAFIQRYFRGKTVILSFDAGTKSSQQ